MALAKKTLKDIDSRLRQAYQKGMEMAKSNPAYGILIMVDIVKQNPGFTEARKFLREIELRKKPKGGLGGFFAKLKGTKIATQAGSALKKDPMAALALVEDALAININTPQALNVMADAADVLEAPFLAIEAMEIMSRFAPNDLNILERLARAYQADNNGAEVLRIRQRMCDLKPTDMELQTKMREAAALATLTGSTWGKDSEGGDFRDKIKSADEAKKLEQQDRIARNADDVAELISEFEADIANGDESIDKRRRLAEYYQRADRHEDAIAAFRWVADKTGRLDPTIDKAIEKSEVALMEAQAAANPDQADAINAEIYGLRLGRAETRVENYPNDLQLRYELAELYWEGESYDMALEQFQLAQRNPQKRLFAMVFIGRIFHIKKQYDMAIEQFEEALKEMYVMDALKMDTLYYYGLLLEDAGQTDKARDCFRQIYQANVRYRDVKQRIEGNVG